MSEVTFAQLAVTGPEQIELVDTPRAPLGPTQVAGRTLVTLVSPGTELAYAYTATQGFPFRPGYAAVFRVEEVGAEVATLVPGELAFCMGPHAAWQQVEAGDALPLPAGLDPERAVCARLMGVSMSTLTTTAARPPEPVGVTGLGPVGHFAAQIFQAAGYEVVAVDPVAPRRKWAEQAGVRRVAEALPEGEELALVAECSGHEAAVLAGCRAVRRGGEVVLIGVPWVRQTELTAQELLHAVFHRYVHLRSGWEWEVPLHPAPFRAGSIYGQFAGALRWLAEGRIQVEGLYTRHAPARAQEVYQALLDRKTDRLLAMFDWQDGSD